MKKLFFILLMGMFMISFSSAFDFTTNLSSYWKLDDNLFDVLGVHNLTGTSEAFFPAVINNGLTTGWAEAADSSDFDFSGSFSISVWFEQNSTTTPGVMVAKQETDVAKSTDWYIDYAPATNTLRFFSNGENILESTADDMDKGQGFFHIAVTRDNSDNMVLYVNAVSRDTANNGTDFTDTDILELNARSDGQVNGNSNLDEIGIWKNRTLSQSEVTELYNSGGGLPFGSISKVDVVLDYPENGVTIGGDITFNATITPPSGFNLTNATLFVWDLNDDIFTKITNVVTGNDSKTTSFLVTNLTTGNYKWNVLGLAVNGTGFLASNFSVSNYTFAWVPFNVDNEIFNAEVFETSRQEFLINITTLPSVLSLDAILNYNGTRFTADAICSSGLCQISTAIDIPLVSTGENENKSFFWEISVFDGTSSLSTNLSVNEQNVTRLHLEKCDGTFTVETLNFTAFDEETEALVDPFSFDGSFQFWLGTGNIKRNNSISEASVSSLQLCLTPSGETFSLNGTVEYDEASGTNYTIRNWYFQNDQINNISQDIKLGLLLAEDSTTFILKVQDRDILPVPNVLIFTERFYPSEGIFKVVQVSETDENGRTVGFFQTETVEYRFILKQNGATVLTTNKQKIVGESVPFTLTFTIGEDEGAAWEQFEPIDNLNSSVNYNTTSMIASFTYGDTSESFTLGRLIVEKVNASGLQNTVVCSKTSVESSAIITCNLTDNSTGQYIMRGIITRDSDPFLVEQESFAIENFSTISRRLGLFLGWFVILIAVFAFKFNEVAGIILLNLAIIFVNLIGLIAFGYVFISAMIAISIIILVVLER